MKERDEQAFHRKKAEIMETCFGCHAENGLPETGIQALANACGLSKASLYTYFDSLDDLIVESTAYCMSKVEDDFMLLAPKGMEDNAQKTSFIFCSKSICVLRIAAFRMQLRRMVI